jgi:DNA invertase Pin-like site-specific DNA recombinase
MISKVEDQHLERQAYVYLRQSTAGQVLHNRESTERQYALKDKALDLGWAPSMIRMLDRDLGISGTRMAGREDFKLLVSDVAAGKVGAVFALEASRLARSSLDWHRLIQICSLTATIVVDEDGVYDPADFNDALLLGLKGTIAQAELHFMRARLLGGRLNKARKGELRLPLPVGFVHGDQGIGLDPDQEIQGAVRILFDTFRETGSAYAVVQRFAEKGFTFPKRAYGGIWNGRMISGRLTHGRVIDVLKNPAYTGAYVYGRYRYKKEVSSSGDFRVRMIHVPRESWQVTIQDHHQGYITWDEFLRNQAILQKNRPHGEATLLSGPAREGLALLQGLCICGKCGLRLTVFYQGNGGVYPVYRCCERLRYGGARSGCLIVRCDLLDDAVSKRVLEVIQPAELEIALAAVRDLEERSEATCRQWKMRLERAEYEAQLAQRRYEEIDPSNRLVAATLERGWEEALKKFEELKTQFADFQRREIRIASPEERARVLALAKDFPRLWNAPTTKAKDRKRMLRLLIKDITVEKTVEPKQAILHIRWQGGACETLAVDLPLRIMDRFRYPHETVERVRRLAETLSDKQIAETFNQEGRVSAKGKPFTRSMIAGIRFLNEIPVHKFQRPEGQTVRQVARRFGVSPATVRYWINKGVLQAHKENRETPLWLTIDPKKEEELEAWVRNSPRIHRTTSEE